MKVLQSLLSITMLAAYVLAAKGDGVCYLNYGGICGSECPNAGTCYDGPNGVLIKAVCSCVGVQTQERDCRNIDKCSWA
jgi:hypothetical protein